MEKQAFGKMKELYRLPTTFSVDEKMAFIQEFKSFLFVRHPFVRLVSTFRDKIIKSQYKNFRTRVHYKNDLPEEKMFRSYIAMIMNGKFGEDPHIDFYWRQCNICNINYNVIGKMETFDTDMKYVMNFVSKIKCSDKAIFTFQSLILLFVGKFEKY